MFTRVASLSQRRQCGGRISSTHSRVFDRTREGGLLAYAITKGDAQARRRFGWERSTRSRWRFREREDGLRLVRVVHRECVGLVVFTKKDRRVAGDCASRSRRVGHKRDDGILLGVI